MTRKAQTQSDSLEWLDELNPEQRRAVTHGDGPLLVVAGAGTGKTKTLACRVAWLVAQGTPPERILLLTFTRRAAEEMLKRADERLAAHGAAAGKVWGGTFHSTANRLLRIHARAAELSPDFTVMDEGDSEDLLNVVRHELKLAGKDKRFPRKSTCRSIYSRCVNGQDDLKDVLDRHFPWCAEWQAELKDMFKHYVIRKQERSLLDYDDLLLYWAQLVEDDALAAALGGRFDHVLVDEYQDTNPVQARILRGMRRTHPNIMVVGDDAQSIYGFRAATVRNILDFPTHFPGAALVKLETNYRSVAPILETTNLLIAQSRERYTKNLRSSRGDGARPRLIMCRDEDAQTGYIIRQVLEHYEQGIPLRRQAVLFRTGYHSDALEVELTRRKIPFHKYGGLRFLEAAHVKDLIALLRIAENPRDDIAWFRVLQLVDGIGPAAAGRAIRHVGAHGNDPRQLRAFPAPAGAAPGLKALAALFDDLLAPGKRPPASDVERVRRFYDPLMKKNYDNAKVRARDLESLEQIAAGYRSRQSFITDLQLDPPSSTGDLAGVPSRDEDWLNLSTIHSAKGCEWDVVFLIHAADGCLPSDMATGTPEEIDEELRLAYVAMTRAKDFLYVSWPLRYYHKWSRFTDRHSYAQPCRFLTEAVQKTMDSITLDLPEADDGVSPAAASGSIAKRMRDRWE